MFQKHFQVKEREREWEKEIERVREEVGGIEKVEKVSEWERGKREGKREKEKVIEIGIDRVRTRER